MGNEIRDIMDTKEKQLFYEPTLSEDGEKVYTNREGDRYYFEDTGEITGYTCSEDAFGKNEAKADLEEVKEAAEKYLESVVEDPSYYQLKDIGYDEYVYVYSFLYTHQVDGVDTNDVVILGIDNELNLLTFSLPRPYAFQEMDDISIDQEKIKKEDLDFISQGYEGSNLEGTKVTDLRLLEQEGEIGCLVQLEIHNEIEGEVIESLDAIIVPI